MLTSLVFVPGAEALSTTCTGQAVAITDANVADAERSLQCLVNVYRTENGLNPVSRDADLEEASRLHSFDMVQRGYFSHDATEGPGTAPRGALPWDRAETAGYPANDPGVAIGENLAAAPGPPVNDPISIFEVWRTSPACNTVPPGDPCGHNENMLDPEWSTGGLGVIRGHYGDGVTPQGFDQGVVVTSLLASLNRGGTDFADDLRNGDPLGDPGPPTDGGGNGGGGGGDDCADEEQDLGDASAVFKRAKAARARALAQFRRAGSRRARRKAKRKLAAKTRAFKRAKNAHATARERYDECLAGL